MLGARVARTLVLCLLFAILLVCDPLKTIGLERPGTSFFVLFARFLQVRRRDPSALFAHLPRIFGKSCACLTFTILDFWFCPVSVVVSHYQFVFFRVMPLCEGWRPVVYGTPTLTEWPVPILSLFLVLCHCVTVGVPLITGRQPSQNGQCHFSCF